MHGRRKKKCTTIGQEENGRRKKKVISISLMTFLWQEKAGRRAARGTSILQLSDVD